MCQECGFYKGRLVIDMKAKSEARTARMTAKKEAIKGQQAAEEAQGGVESIPGAEHEESVLPEEAATAKTDVVEAPEMAPTKTAKPRKQQAS